MCESCLNEQYYAAMEIQQRQGIEIVVVVEKLSEHENAMKSTESTHNNRAKGSHSDRKIPLENQLESH